MPKDKTFWNNLYPQCLVVFDLYCITLLLFFVRNDVGVVSAYL